MVIEPILLFGIPVEFILFALTLLGGALAANIPANVKFPALFDALLGPRRRGLGRHFADGRMARTGLEGGARDLQGYHLPARTRPCSTGRRPPKPNQIIDPPKPTA